MIGKRYQTILVLINLQIKENEAVMERLVELGVGAQIYIVCAIELSENETPKNKKFYANMARSARENMVTLADKYIISRSNCMIKIGNCFEIIGRIVKEKGVDLVLMSEVVFESFFSTHERMKHRIDSDILVAKI